MKRLLILMFILMIAFGFPPLQIYNKNMTFSVQPEPVFNSTDITFPICGLFVNFTYFDLYSLSDKTDVNKIELLYPEYGFIDILNKSLGYFSFILPNVTHLTNLEIKLRYGNPNKLSYSHPVANSVYSNLCPMGSGVPYHSDWTGSGVSQKSQLFIYYPYPYLIYRYYDILTYPNTITKVEGSHVLIGYEYNNSKIVIYTLQGQSILGITFDPETKSITNCIKGYSYYDFVKVNLYKKYFGDVGSKYIFFGYFDETETPGIFIAPKNLSGYSNTVLMQTNLTFFQQNINSSIDYLEETSTVLVSANNDTFFSSYAPNIYITNSPYPPIYFPTLFLLKFNGTNFLKYVTYVFPPTYSQPSLKHLDAHGKIGIAIIDDTVILFNKTTLNPITTFSTNPSPKLAFYFYNDTLLLVTDDNRVSTLNLTSMNITYTVKSYQNIEGIEIESPQLIYLEIGKEPPIPLSFKTKFINPFGNLYIYNYTKPSISINASNFSLFENEGLSLTFYNTTYLESQTCPTINIGNGIGSVAVSPEIRITQYSIDEEDTDFHPFTTEYDLNREESQNGVFLTVGLNTLIDSSIGMFPIEREFDLSNYNLPEDYCRNVVVSYKGKEYPTWIIDKEIQNGKCSKLRLVWVMDIIQNGTKTIGINLRFTNYTYFENSSFTYDVLPFPKQFVETFRAWNGVQRFGKDVPDELFVEDDNTTMNFLLGDINRNSYLDFIHILRSDNQTNITFYEPATGINKTISIPLESETGFYAYQNIFVISRNSLGCGLYVSRFDKSLQPLGTHILGYECGLTYSIEDCDGDGAMDVLYWINDTYYCYSSRTLSTELIGIFENAYTVFMENGEPIAIYPNSSTAVLVASPEKNVTQDRLCSLVNEKYLFDIFVNGTKYAVIREECTGIVRLAFLNLETLELEKNLTIARIGLSFNFSNFTNFVKVGNLILFPVPNKEEFWSPDILILDVFRTTWYPGIYVISPEGNLVDYLLPSELVSPSKFDSNFYSWDYNTFIKFVFGRSIYNPNELFLFNNGLDPQYMVAEVVRPYNPANSQYNPKITLLYSFEYPLTTQIPAEQTRPSLGGGGGGAPSPPQIVIREEEKKPFHTITFVLDPPMQHVSVYGSNGDFFGTYVIVTESTMRVPEDYYYFVFWEEGYWTNTVPIFVDRDMDIESKLERSEHIISFRLVPDVQKLRLFKDDKLLNETWVNNETKFGVDTGTYTFEFSAPGYSTNTLTLYVDGDTNITSILKPVGLGINLIPLLISLLFVLLALKFY